MKYTTEINYSSVLDIMSLCKYLEENIDTDEIYASNDKYTVNAKSILGIISLDSYNFTLTCISDNQSDIDIIKKIPTEYRCPYSEKIINWENDKI